MDIKQEKLSSVINRHNSNCTLPSEYKATSRVGVRQHRSKMKEPNGSIEKGLCDPGTVWTSNLRHQRAILMGVALMTDPIPVLPKARLAAPVYSHNILSLVLEENHTIVLHESTYLFSFSTTMLRTIFMHHYLWCKA